jgi:hypothetical protein
VRFWVETELAYRELAARPAGSAPTTEQRQFLSLLSNGTRHSGDLVPVVDFGDPDVAAAVRDAIGRGWIKDMIAIGGVLVRPPTWFEITPLGRQKLAG